MSLINPDALKIGSKIVRIKKKKKSKFSSSPSSETYISNFSL